MSIWCGLLHGTVFSACRDDPVPPRGENARRLERRKEDQHYLQVTGRAVEYKQPPRSSAPCASSEGKARPRTQSTRGVNRFWVFLSAAALQPAASSASSVGLQLHVHSCTAAALLSQRLLRAHLVTVRLRMRRILVHSSISGRLGGCQHQLFFVGRCGAPNSSRILSFVMLMCAARSNRVRRPFSIMGRAA